VRNETLLPSMDRFALALLFGALVIVASFGTAAAADKKDQFRFSLPISYDAFGIGPQPTMSTVTLAQGQEPKKVTFALIQALQALHLSVVKPKDVDLSDPLPQNTRFATNTVPLTRQDIDEHNTQFPSAKMPTDRLYELEFQGRFKIVDRELVVELTPVLHYRGRIGKLRQYNNAFGGQFFHRKLKALLVAQLMQATPAGGAQ
jgi:hypothetical protein